MSTVDRSILSLDRHLHTMLEVMEWNVTYLTGQKMVWQNYSSRVTVVTKLRKYSILCNISLTFVLTYWTKCFVRQNFHCQVKFWSMLFNEFFSNKVSYIKLIGYIHPLPGQKLFIPLFLNMYSPNRYQSSQEYSPWQLSENWMRWCQDHA